jgi:hypothetical protein
VQPDDDEGQRILEAEKDIQSVLDGQYRDLLKEWQDKSNPASSETEKPQTVSAASYVTVMAIAGIAQVVEWFKKTRAIGNTNEEFTKTNLLLSRPSSTEPVRRAPSPCSQVSPTRNGMQSGARCASY